MSQVIARHKVEDAPKFYGGAREFWRYKGVEVILSGPYETGKTFAMLTKLHALNVKYAGSMSFIFRQTYKSLLTTAVKTYENKVLPVSPDDVRSPIKKFGGSRPEFYQYPNGSQIHLVGLDNPDKLLSSEIDFAANLQAEETPLNAWEQVLSRMTGRSGNAPYTQLMADCNPGPPTHWILSRQSLKMFPQLHTHNPTLYDQETGEITEQGKRTMEVLGRLTGVRYKRGVLGLWVGVEGAVYEGFDHSLHAIDPFEIPDDWKRIRAIDFGYTNPFVCQWWAIDPDGRMYLYREIYMSQRTVADHAKVINQFKERIDYTVADHDAEDRETLRRLGIPTKAAKKEVSPGIEAVQLRLRKAGDGEPRLFIFKNAVLETDTMLVDMKRPTSTLDEIGEYAYPEGVDGKPNKEHPIKDNDHGMDCMRYAVMSLDGPPTILFMTD